MSGMAPADPDQVSTATLRLMEKAEEGPNGWVVRTDDERAIAEMVAEELGEPHPDGVLLGGRGVDLLAAIRPAGP